MNHAAAVVVSIVGVFVSHLGTRVDDGHVTSRTENTWHERVVKNTRYVVPKK